MNHLSDWIIPHLGGRFEINHFVVPIPRNPALLGQETSFTWRPGTGRYTKHSAHSGRYDTPQQSATSSRVRLCDSETPRLWDSKTPKLWDSEALRFWNSETLIADSGILRLWIFCITESILVLRNRFRYYRICYKLWSPGPNFINKYFSRFLEFSETWPHLDKREERSLDFIQNRSQKK